MKKCFTALLVLLSQIGWSQQSDKQFSTKLLPVYLLNEINRYRMEKGLDTLEFNSILQLVAEIGSVNLSDQGNDKQNQKFFEKRLKSAGVSKKASELSAKTAIQKGKEEIPTAEVARAIFTKWKSSNKSLAVINQRKAVYAGINGTIDEEGKKVYVNFVSAAYDIDNSGKNYRKTLNLPYNTKTKKLKTPDDKTCRNCERFTKFDALHQGLRIENNRIYLRFENARDLRRLLKKEKDGLAVDIVQKNQFMQPAYNVVDNNLYNKGYMLNIIYKDKFFKKNRLLSKDKKANRKVKGIEVEMGKFNPKTEGPFELNLLVFQNGRMCRQVIRSYNYLPEIESNTPVGLIPFPGTTSLQPAFEPKSEGAILNFVIPFQKNKSEFKTEDIQPFIRALNEPEFIIDGLYIYAYSSIEGDSVSNVVLQKKRAESVIKILQDGQSSRIQPSIITRDSWGLFLLENEDGPYADIVAAGKQAAIRKINASKKLQNELEPTLARGRFAQVIMDVTYDVSDKKENKFSRIAFQRSVQEKNDPQSFKIIDFISKRISEGKYTASMLDSLLLGNHSAPAAVQNNLMYYKYRHTREVDEDDLSRFNTLLATDQTHPVLRFNQLYCTLKLDSNVADPAHQAEVQQKIDNLYGDLDSALVDGLNIEWQFRIMESLDTTDNSDVLLEACINRIKQFYRISDASWQNTLKLSLVFARTGNHRYAAELLEPFIRTDTVPDQRLLFSYISSAGRLNDKIHTRTFGKAMELAKDQYPEQFCELIGTPRLSFQVLENPAVKSIYLKSCN